ncbi:hypothetical protein F53441_10913 [Fusarium austroafricanum]|uniref:Uncharacterized protein n=1 Tax=Fusarium austroafricanum TaxID=2364996 RepID=A0A8H4NNU7_9HYPO|nr:hypothetical protein F53441_10913 [Fusarium austroafricanum]
MSSILTYTRDLLVPIGLMRADTVTPLANLLSNLPGHHRILISGLDAAGKSTLLRDHLASHEKDVLFSIPFIAFNVEVYRCGNATLHAIDIGGGRPEPCFEFADKVKGVFGTNIKTGEGLEEAFKWLSESAESRMKHDTGVNEKTPDYDKEEEIGRIILEGLKPAKKDNVDEKKHIHIIPLLETRKSAWSCTLMKLARLPWALFAFLVCINAAPTRSKDSEAEKSDNKKSSANLIEPNKIVKSEIIDPARNAVTGNKTEGFENLKEKLGKPESLKTRAADFLQQTTFVKSEKPKKKEEKEEKMEGEETAEMSKSKPPKNILQDPGFEGDLWKPKGIGAEIPNNSCLACTGTKSALFTITDSKYRPKLKLENVPMPAGTDFTITGWYRVVKGDIKKEDDCQVSFENEGGALIHPILNGNSAEDNGYRYFSLATVGWIPGNSLTLTFECQLNIGNKRTVAIAIDDLAVSESRGKRLPGDASNQVLKVNPRTRRATLED